MKVMNVEIAIIALLVVSIALIAFSYFQREPIKEVEQELETLQLSAMQEIYKLKKKMTVLEEELLDSNVVVRQTECRNQPAYCEADSFKISKRHVCRRHRKS